MTFKAMDRVTFIDRALDKEVKFVVLHDQLMLKGVFVSTEAIEEAVDALQGFAVRFSIGEYGFCLCTETDMNFFLPMMDAVSFDDVISVIRNGEEVLLTTDK